MHSGSYNQREDSGLAMVLVLVTAVVAIGAVLIFTAYLDERRAVAAKIYEECILKQYETTPQDYYLANGKYPVCIPQTNVSK